METKKIQSKGMLWTGRIISILCILFLLVDAGMKVVEAKQAIEGSAQLGWPTNAVQSLGIILLISTILYAIPRTAVLGALLLTAYLGGAVAVMIMASVPGHPYLFPVIFGVLVWAGQYLRDEKLREIVPVRKN